MSSHVFRLIKDEPDDRDLKFTLPEAPIDTSAPPTMPIGPSSRYIVRGIPKAAPRTPTLPALPITFDLRSRSIKVPAVLDQGAIGSCAPNQLSNALRFCLASQKLLEFQPSRLFIYFFARLVDGSPLTQDTGISIRGGLKAIQRFGAPKEELCPYIPADFAKQPNKDAVLNARLRIMNSFQYLAVEQNLEFIKRAINAGFPVIMGIQVYESIESKNTSSTGVITLPDKKKERCYGGHCVSLWGWDDGAKVFNMMNTWGTNVGKNGWFTLPYAYVLDPALAFDLWTIRYWK